MNRDSLSLGLWIYIMSDCVLFASLFAAYAVLSTETAGGPSGHALFDLSFVLVETLILLSSSFLAGLAVIAARAWNVAGTWAALGATLLLGASFIAMELSEFAKLAAAGHGPSASAFLSSFFALVGLHGLHVFGGCLWMLALMAYLGKRGMTERAADRIFYFALFWHFLDIVWICIFSFVYLFGIL